MSTQKDNVIDADQQEPGTALVIRRLSLVPEGAHDTALTIVDQFALAAPTFTDNSEALVTAAEQFEVNDQVASQLADDIQDGLKNEIKEWDEKRLTVTRPIDDLKNYITGLIETGIESRRKAIGIYQGKISALRTKVREAELLAQREAERVLAAERAKLEEEARKREEKAQTLRTEAGRQKAAEDAQRLREQAAMVPESVAIASSGPLTSSSSIAQPWEGSIRLCDACEAADKKRHDPKRECPHNRKLAVASILAKWDEWGGVITFKPAGLNDMAKKYKDTLTLPGLTFEQRDSFRSKPRK